MKPWPTNPFRIVRTICLGLVIGMSLTSAEPATAGRPNIVLIMIDDLGWMDLACQGNPLVETPHVDAFARQGMRFTDNYAAAPVCSPTRAAIMTGLSPARLHITNHLPDQARFIPDQAALLPAQTRDHLALEYTTLAEHLQRSGYATAFLGKWHLSQRGNTDFQPEHQGFDLNIGGCDFGGPPTFFDPYRIPTIRDRKRGEYLPNRLADEAVRWVRAHRDEPFFLCLWNYTVHWPMEAPASLLKKYEGRVGRGLHDSRYGAMIEAMDSAFGTLMEELDALDLAQETLVVFTSDNGAFGGVGDNRPLRAEKGYLYEGGIRVPMIVRWPGVVPPASVCDAPTISMDLFPTILDAADVELAAETVLDGVTLLPLFQGDSLKREAIYFHYPNYAFHKSNRLGSAIRMGSHKLIEYFDYGSTELYDLAEDLSEKHDLSAALPERSAELRSLLETWRMEVGANMPTPR